MMKFRSCVLLFGLATAGLAAAHGQAIPAATQPGVLTVGIDGSLSTTDIFTGSKAQLEGIGGYADYELTPHVAGAVDVHFQDIVTPNDVAMNTYLIGAKYKWRWNRLIPYAKVEVGIGSLYTVDNDPVFLPATGKFFAIALGGGTDVKIKGHWYARVDAEYQDWPGYSEHGLNPLVGSIGLGYRFRP